MEIFILLIAFQIKHFLCDYPLQGQYMLGKFKGGWDWVMPLTSHALVHSMATLIICYAYMFLNGGEAIIAVALAAMDFAAHFIVDRIKASPKLGGRLNMYNPKFWWALGADQSAHHLTHYLIISLLLGV